MQRKTDFPFRLISANKITNNLPLNINLNFKYLFIIVSGCCSETNIEFILCSQQKTHFEKEIPSFRDFDGTRILHERFRQFYKHRNISLRF